MCDISFQIKNPSVTLFAFHLRQDLSQQLGQQRQDSDHLWQQCAKLSDPLATSGLKKTLLEKLSSDQTQNSQASGYLELLPNNSRLSFQSEIQLEGSALQVTVYPVQIHDTYAVDLTLYYQEVTTSAGQFSQLNPSGCLLASNIQASLGQTLLLYAEPLDDPEQDEALANACVKAFLERTNQQRPAFVKGTLFGSPIFEYDNGQENPVDQCHILVWLDRHPETVELAQKTYRSFLNLLCCRSKILFAYHQSRYCYSQARKLYSELEKKIETFKQPPTQLKERLDQFKDELTQMPLKEFNYACCLRDLEDHKTTIATNVKNYDYWLGKIRESSLKDDQLEFLENFLNQTCQQFQNQIQVDLGHLAPARHLISQMIASIRGIVEIEQAERDRQMQAILKESEKNEKERDAIKELKDKRSDLQLQLTIGAVGFGLAVSGVTSQVEPRPIEALCTQLPIVKDICTHLPLKGMSADDSTHNLALTTCDVFFHTGIGLVFGLVAYIVLRYFFRSHLKEEKQGS